MKCAFDIESVRIGVGVEVGVDVDVGGDEDGRNSCGNADDYIDESDDGVPSFLLTLVMKPHYYFCGCSVEFRESRPGVAIPRA